MSQPDLREALGAFAPEPALDGGLFDRVAGGVRRRRRRTGMAVVAAVATVMLASPLAIYALRAPAPPVQVAASDAARLAATERDVAERLASYPLPAGAHRLPGPPAGTPANMVTLRWPTGSHLVRRTEWYRLPGDMATTDTWFISHPPPGGGGLSYSGPPTDGYQVTWEWPNLPGRIGDREAQVIALRTGDGILVRVDAWALWVPARPPDLMIGPSVVSLTVLLHSKGAGLGDPTVPARTFGPTTFTDPTRVAAVVRLVNGLSMAMPYEGPMSCPADTGGSMQVDFTDRGGHLVDRLRITLSGCLFIGITAADGATAWLAGLSDGSTTVAGAILSLLGLDWPVYSR